MNDKAKKPSTPSASIQLVGNQLNEYNAVKQHMINTLPGINPDRAQVMRHALWMAAQQVPVGVHDGIDKEAIEEE